MSAPLAANSDRNASGIWSRKSDMEGWSRTLGQIATYIATRSTRASDHPSRLRRWSNSVLPSTSRSTAAPLEVARVEREERLLQVGLGALEVVDAVLGDPLEQRVERVLGGVAGEHLTVDPDVSDPGHVLEVRRPDVVEEGGAHPVQGVGGEHLQLLHRHQPALPEHPDPVGDALHL